MNPELLRNFWLELTPRRLAVMTAILVLAFFATALLFRNGQITAASWLFVLIVVVFGTRAAALAIAGEIRAHTWVAQRLSGIGPAAFTVGKLFGSTIYAWYGGLISLAVLAIGTAVREGTRAAVVASAFYVALGIGAQAAALLSSLVGIRRGHAISILAISLFQLAGLSAAGLIGAVWLSLRAPAHIPSIQWWGFDLEVEPFLLISFFALAGWLIVGCYREIRRELQMENGPFVWIFFLFFMGLYVAGFSASAAKISMLAGLDSSARALALVLATFVSTTYVAVLIEPKDRSRLRAFLRPSPSGLTTPDIWMTSYAAALVAGLALASLLFQMQGASLTPALIAAILGFLTRDLSIFVLSNARRSSGDGLALATLVVLYLVLPAIVGGLKLDQMLFAFYPLPTSPVWLGAAAAWTEAIVAAVLAFVRLSTGERRPKSKESSLATSAPA